MILLPTLVGILITRDEPVSKYVLLMVLNFLSCYSLYGYCVRWMYFNYAHLPAISCIADDYRFPPPRPDTFQRIDNQGSLSLEGVSPSGYLHVQGFRDFTSGFMGGYPVRNKKSCPHS
jgi:hypothetical protein